MVKEQQQLTDIELIESYKEGNRQSLDILISRYKNYIFNLSYRFMHNYEDSMDLTQEVLIRVYKAIDKYEDRNYFKGWLYRIVSNTAINTYSKSYKRESPYLEKLYLLDDDKYDMERDYERIVLKEKIYEAANKLKGKQRDVFMLRYYDNNSYKEVGKTLNISADSAKSNYSYALKRMKILLEKEKNF